MPIQARLAQLVLVYYFSSAIYEVGGDVGAAFALFALAFRDPAAREQLDGRGWTVDGGYLMRLVIPQRGPDGQMQAPPLPNFIDLYLQMLEHMLSQRSAG